MHNLLSTTKAFEINIDDKLTDEKLTLFQYFINEFDCMASVFDNGNLSHKDQTTYLMITQLLGKLVI